jgi:acetyl-CoA carboxylase biotin carboxyl carrier protein
VSAEDRTSTEQLVALLDAFEGSDWQDMTVEIGGERLVVSRREQGSAEVTTPSAAGPPPRSEPAAVAVAASVPVAASPAAPVTAAAPTGTAVPSPSVGIFWRAPSPTEPPFVEVGSRVHADDTIGIVEVMKLMQQVTAGISGVVTAIAVGNAETVAHNQPLVFIDPVG